jgi:hypothetical protein
VVARASIRPVRLAQAISSTIATAIISIVSGSPKSSRNPE